MRIVLLDHYDSFTYNVLDWLASGVPELVVQCVRADDTAALAELARRPMPLVLSPGPKRPDDWPKSLLLAKNMLGKVPILGICLGHQILAQCAGMATLPLQNPVHGVTKLIEVGSNCRLLRGVAPTFPAGVYNSLTATGEQGLAPGWAVAARSAGGEIQALSYEPIGAAPAFGLQFHPESFLSAEAAKVRANWASVVADWYGKPKLRLGLSN